MKSTLSKELILIINKEIQLNYSKFYTKIMRYFFVDYKRKI